MSTAPTSSTPLLVTPSTSRASSQDRATRTTQKSVPQHQRQGRPTGETKKAEIEVDGKNKARSAPKFVLRIKDKMLPSSPRRRFVTGVGLLLCVVVLWTTSNFITSDLLEGGYNKPFL
jgi:hypothetical protein